MSPQSGQEKPASGKLPGMPVNELRVAVVSPEHSACVMGGAEYQAKLLIERLWRNLGAEVVYFAANAPETRTFETHSVVRVGRNGFMRRYGNFWDFFRLQRALRRFRPHVIYQRVGGAYTGICALYARRANIPMVWHIANEADCDKLPSLTSLFRRPHFFVERLLMRFGGRNADRIVVQSETQARLLRKNLNRESTLIHNFHPLPRKSEIADKKPIVLWVANLKPLKRPEAMLEIAGYLEDAGEIRFVMVGRPFLRSSLQLQFEESLSKHKNVEYIAGASQDEVNKLLQISSLLVNTSSREGFSNAFIQAWMRGVPVLTLGVNPDDLLDGGDLGRACASTKEIADQIRFLSNRGDRLAQMGKRCREFAIAKFSMKNADDLTGLIAKTASRDPDAQSNTKVTV